MDALRAFALLLAQYKSTNPDAVYSDRRLSGTDKFVENSAKLTYRYLEISDHQIKYSTVFGF